VVVEVVVVVTTVVVVAAGFFSGSPETATTAGNGRQRQHLHQRRQNRRGGMARGVGGVGEEIGRPTVKRSASWARFVSLHLCSTSDGGGGGGGRGLLLRLSGGARCPAEEVVVVRWCGRARVALWRTYFIAGTGGKVEVFISYSLPGGC
jgi:hypothetical protein